MHKLLMSIKKELLLLIRDWGGLVILFVMPLVLIITITLIQDGAFKSVGENKIPILIVDNDQGKISEMIKKSLSQSKAFEVIEFINTKKLTESSAKNEVFKGNYQLAIIIPSKLSNDLDQNIKDNVTQIMESFTSEKAIEKSKNQSIRKEIKLYFDPATQNTFKSSIKNGIDKMVSELETQTVYKAFANELGTEGEMNFGNSKYITFKEIEPIKLSKEKLPNSVQHNVPAWTLFAIFFIIVPLSINIVKEKSQGTFVRLITNPVPFSTVLLGKTFTYLIICLIQFWLMIGVGIFLFPYLGLPQLYIENKIILLNTIAVFSGLAAIGFGLLLGTIANTQEQSAPFGATSVVILAAIGGVWVPVFAMPKIMQYISNLSPMNWGLNAFYDVLLRNGNFGSIVPELISLLAFFLATTYIAIYYDKKKRAV